MASMEVLYPVESRLSMKADLRMHGRQMCELGLMVLTGTQDLNVLAVHR